MSSAAVALLAPEPLTLVEAPLAWGVGPAPSGPAPTDSPAGIGRLVPRLRRAGMALVAGVAGYFVVTHLAQIRTAAGALGHADPRWIALALVAAGVTYVLAAVILRVAAPRRLPLGRTIAAQLAAASANRISPAGVGAMGVNVRYLQRSGSTRPEAVSTVSVGVVTGFVVHLAMILTLLVVAAHRPSMHLGALPSWTVGATAIIAGAAGALAVWHWQLHLWLLESLRSARAHARSIVTEPRRVLALVGASAGISLAHAVALTACLAAVGGHLALTDALLVYLAGSAFGAVAPAPAGIGAVEAALIAGVGHLGIHPATAVAGVLSYRLVTYWLPVLPGLACAAALRRRHAI